MFDIAGAVAFREASLIAESFIVKFPSTNVVGAGAGVGLLAVPVCVLERNFRKYGAFQ